MLAFDHIFKIPVAGRNQAHIHRQRLNTPPTLKNVRSSTKRKQLNLHAERHFAYFVQ